MIKKILITYFILSSLAFGKESIIVFHAGSLSVPFSKIEKAFEKIYPEYDVVREAAGSRVCARKVSELRKPADIVASADYSVIDNLLIPNFAKFNIHFATNEMAIAYTNRSKYNNIINSTNWPEILLKKDVKIGHSNPNLDPCGYRSILVVKLAEKFYKFNNFYNKLLGYYPYYKNGDENKEKVIVRPKETDLLGLLEAGVIDYLFIYKSVAKQHKLKYIELPEKISLKTSKYSNYYKSVSFKILGKAPGKFIEKKGAPMVYGITILEKDKKYPHNKKGAIKLLKFILSGNGRKIIEDAGQNTIDPFLVTGDSLILKNLK